jgi:pullulanase
VAVFNDAIRDGLKGSVYEKAGTGYISGNYASNTAKVQFGIMGGKGPGVGWQVTDGMVINYMSAHDNHTLWDKLAISNASNTVAERLAMNRMGAAILMISRGTPFMQAGEEMLRTKGGDENSYKSSDAVNNIDWEALVPGSDVHNMMLYYKGLMEMRKAYSVFTSTDVEITFETLGSGGMVVRYGNEAVVLINPTASSASYSLTGEWKLVANGQQAGSAAIATVTGDVTVESMTVQVYVK